MGPLRNGTRLALLSVLTLCAGCGLIIGQAMVAGTGVTKLEVVEGDPATIERGATLLVIAPFALTDEAYHIARGDDAARFTEEFAARATFVPIFHFEVAPGASEKLAAELRGLAPEEAARRLGLETRPDYLLAGTILSRENIVAPVHGVVTEAAYRLEFVKLGGGEIVTVECGVKEIFRDAVPALVEALDGLIP